MDVENIRDICKVFPGVTEDIKWEHHLCFCVAEKMFLMLGLDETPVTASLKVSDEDFDEISGRAGFKPAPYMARNKWVWVDDINRMDKKEWQLRARNAYEIIRSRLPKKTQALLK
ncbi:MAG TPA: MmcQ/YjbR family DNA-binding protein [Chitinophagaceae bacterium]